MFKRTLTGVANTAITTGQAVVRTSAGTFDRANTATLLTAGTWAGVATTTAEAGETFTYQADGVIGVQVTQLATGVVNTVSINESTSYLERVSGNFPLGSVDTLGNVFIYQYPNPGGGTNGVAGNDLSGIYPAPNVVRLNTASIPAPVLGNAGMPVKANGVASLTYAAIDLSTETTGSLNISQGGTNLTTIGAANTVLTSNGTAVNWVQVIDQYVSASANTPGTAAYPVFNQDVVGGGLRLGATPRATTGVIRMGSNQVFLGMRTLANTDYRAIHVDGNDILSFGQTNYPGGLTIYGPSLTFSSNHVRVSNSANVAAITFAGNTGVVSFTNTSSPTVSHDLESSSDGRYMVFQGDEGSTFGGAVTLMSGAGANAQTRGSVTFGGRVVGSNTSPNMPVRYSTTAVVVADANMTLNSVQMTSPVLTVTSNATLTTNRAIILPDQKGATYWVFNNTTGGFALQLTKSGGTGANVLSGGSIAVRHDGDDYRAIVKDSANPGASSGQRKTQTISANATWTCPANVARIELGVLGPGGGGGGGGGGEDGTTSYGGAGGGGGAAGYPGSFVFIKDYPVVPATGYVVNIGTAGTGGAGGTNGQTGSTRPTNGTNGGNATNTVFDKVVAVGGNGGGGGERGGQNATTHQANGGIGYTDGATGGQYQPDPFVDPGYPGNTTNSSNTNIILRTIDLFGVSVNYVGMTGAQGGDGGDGGADDGTYPGGSGGGAGACPQGIHWALFTGPMLSVPNGTNGGNGGAAQVDGTNGADATGTMPAGVGGVGGGGGGGGGAGPGGGPGGADGRAGGSGLAGGQGLVWISWVDPWELD